MKFPSLLFLVLVASSCEAAGPSNYGVQAGECSQKVRDVLRDSLSNAPDFITIHDATKWLEEHLPASIKSRFAEAGRAVSRSLDDWERHGMIHGAFWNIQTLSELLIAQSNHFNGVAGCGLDDELGVTREILQDQIFIALDLKSKSVEKSLAQNGVSDPYYGKMMLMYGTLLDFANVSWKDEQLAQVAKFRLELPEETR